MCDENQSEIEYMCRIIRYQLNRRKLFLSIKVKTSKQIQKTRTGYTLACSQTLYFLVEVRRARVIKDKNRGGLACVQTRLYTGYEGFIDRQRKGVGVTG